MSEDCLGDLSAKSCTLSGQTLLKLKVFKIVLGGFNVMLTEAALHKDLYGFSKWPWSAGQ